jgi:hypothetical protein
MKSFGLIAVILGVFLSQAQALEKHIPQAGPNCFNTSFMILGYTNKQVFTSVNEIEFYLKNFCQANKAIGNKPQVLVYFDEGRIFHSAYSPDGVTVTEKYSTTGTLGQPQPGDPAPGVVLTHKLKDSVYSPENAKEIFGRVMPVTSYSCVSHELVEAKLKPLQKHPAIMEQLKFQDELSKRVMLKDRKVLEENIMNHFVPMMKKMSWDKMLQKIPLKGEDRKYMISLLYSNFYQMNLFNCEESQAKYDECYAPQIQESLDLTKAWFDKVFQYEEDHSL